ncbi:MAG: hypothetical protein J6T04_08595 [Bacteroidales bacterium]|nr:hypothetical protein [Bacteroidales bacterium]
MNYTNVKSIAEMANNADYAAMTYRELLDVKSTYLWAMNQHINPLLETKRHNEMVALSAFYLDSIRMYNATTEETISCLKEASVRENVMFNPSQDVDDQTATAEVVDCPDKGKSILALPEHKSTTDDVDMSILSDMDNKIETRSKGYTVHLDDSLDSSAEIEHHASCPEQIVEAESDSVKAATVVDAREITATEIPEEPIMSERALAQAKTHRLPDNIDATAPYYLNIIVEYKDYKVNSDIRSKVYYGRNLDVKDLEAFRAASVAHLKFYQKKEIKMSTDDYLVYKDNLCTYRVQLYHFPEQEKEVVDAQPLVSYSNRIPYDTINDLHKTHSRMMKAIERAKKFSKSIGSTSVAFYDKYAFYDYGAGISLYQNSVRVIENVETLLEIKSSFEPFVRFFKEGTIVIAEDNCIAVRYKDVIYLLLFNFPNEKKVNMPEKKKRCVGKKKAETVSKDVESPVENPLEENPVEDEDTPGAEEPVADDSTSPETTEQTLAEKAMEKFKRSRVPWDIDVKAPYYIETIYNIDNNGDLSHSSTRRRNISKNDLEALRTASEKFERLFLKDNVLALDDEYLVTSYGKDAIKVRQFHFPESEQQTPSMSADTLTLSKTDLKEWKRKNRMMERTIKKAKEFSKINDTDTNVPFYERFRYKHRGCNIIDLSLAPIRINENNAGTIEEIKSVFETYSRLSNEDNVVLSKKNAVAVMNGETIYIVLFNIPVEKKKRKATKKERVSQKSAPVIKDDTVTKEPEVEVNPSPSQSVRDLILKAVEMTKTLPVSNGTDINSPYFVQNSFCITNNGELILTGKPFGSNVDADGFGKYKKNHWKYAKTMKASALVQTDNYTAYIWNEGKSLTVFYYNTQDKKEAA